MGRIASRGTNFFIIFLCDSFSFEEYIDVASYADDNNPYTTDPNIENTVSSLKSSSARFIYLVSAKHIARESRQLSFLVKYKLG